MLSLSRRTFLAATAGIGAVACAKPVFAGEPPRRNTPIPMLHGTDLFRPHIDPDDHWDLACVYALAYQGRSDLRGVMIDYPPAGQRRDPGVLAVAQMNCLAGKAVPVMVGCPLRLRRADIDKPEAVAALRGVRAYLDVLRQSPRPTTINIVGSCRDVAIAGMLEPDLFAEKCAAIYLNAGSGTPDAAKAAHLEYNVALDPSSYAAIFAMPCPVYWMPCYEEVVVDPGKPSQVREFGTFYQFRQGDVLPHLSHDVQNYFAYTFKHGAFESKYQAADSLRPDWLQYLKGPADRALMARLAAMQRSMWCTGGFLHAVGQAVERDGTIVPLTEAKSPVFTFDPIEVSCSADGVTRWRHDANARKRFIFHVRDQERYAQAMATAMKSLLATLP